MAGRDSRRPKPPLPSEPPAASAWISAVAAALVAIAFLAGGHLGNRAPRPSHLLGLLDLFASSYRILIDGLAWNVFLCCAAWLIFWALGSLLLRLAKCQSPSRLEGALVAAGVGAGVSSLLLLALGLAHLWRTDIISGVFAFAAVGAMAQAIVALRSPRDQSDAPERADSFKASLSALPRAATVLIVVGIGLSLLGTAAPETFFDSLVYHLALPKLYLLKGKIFPTPWSLYSGFPLGIEMLYGAALAVSNENLAILMHCSFGWGAALALWLWLRHRFGAEAATLGAAAFALSPIVLGCGWQSGVDLGTSFFGALALLSGSRMLEASAPSEKLRWSALCGALLGFALGTKYTAAPLAIAFICAHTWACRRQTPGIMNGLVIAGAAALAFAPWLVKNALFYGDPLYPFLHKLMGGAEPAHWDKFLGDAHSRSAWQWLLSFSGLRALFGLPWAATTDGYVSYRVSLAFLILAPSALIFFARCLRNRESMPHFLGTVGLIATLGFASWAATSTIPRFLIPTLVYIGAALSAGADRALKGAGPRRAIWVLILVASGCNVIAMYLEGSSSLTAKWDVLTGVRTKPEYLETARAGYGQPPYSAIQFINKSLPADSRVLFLGESRGFYSERDFIAASVFDHNPFWLAARESNSAKELHSRLAEMGVTHIFVNAFQLYSDSGFHSVLPSELASRETTHEFWSRHLTLLFEKKTHDREGRIKDWLLVYELTVNRNGANKSNPIADVLATLEVRR